jgi:putative tricarboxylic transport membrane protein
VQTREDDQGGQAVGGVTSHRPAWGDLAVAGGIVAAGLFFVLSSLAMPASPGYARVGPGVVPLIGGGVLVTLGAWLGLQAARGHAAEPAAEEDADPTQPTEFRALALIGLGLAMMVLLIRPLGFVLSSTLLFWVAARAFHSRRPLRDAIVGLVLAAITYFAFTSGLGLSLPAGTLFGGR